LRRRERDARQIPHRHLLLVSFPARLDVDTPSLSCTMPAKSFPLFILSHPASRSCHLMKYNELNLSFVRSRPPQTLKFRCPTAGVADTPSTFVELKFHVQLQFYVQLEFLHNLSSTHHFSSFVVVRITFIRNLFYGLKQG
jgi:hypothetical protein